MGGEDEDEDGEREKGVGEVGVGDVEGARDERGGGDGGEGE